MEFLAELHFQDRLATPSNCNAACGNTDFLKTNNLLTAQLTKAFGQRDGRRKGEMRREGDNREEEEPKEK